MTAEPHPPGFVEGEWCHIHRVHEPGAGFLRCFECGHLYETGRALVRTYKAELRAARRDTLIPRVKDDTMTVWMVDTLGVPAPTRWQMVKARAMGWWEHATLSADRVYFCPACLHDF